MRWLAPEMEGSRSSSLAQSNDKRSDVSMQRPLSIKKQSRQEENVRRTRLCSIPTFVRDAIPRRFYASVFVLVSFPFFHLLLILVTAFDIRIPARTRYDNEGYQANYINALAVSVLPFFEPTGPTTLGRYFTTLCNIFY
jgi:hypothetical protein